MRIGADEAARVADEVQAALDRGCTFSFEQTEWPLGAADLGAWVRTRVEERRRASPWFPTLTRPRRPRGCSGSFATRATPRRPRCRSTLMAARCGSAPREGSRYPHTADAAAQAQSALFGSEAAGSDTPSIAIQWGEAPSRTTFDEALEMGLIAPISSFTTEYNDSPATANRRHNIHTAADLLNNSIARADGGEWSFNDTVGEANEEAGFQAAHAIINGEYDDAIGGGIARWPPRCSMRSTRRAIP